MPIREEIYILSACRTGIGDFGGTLKDVMPSTLGRIVIEEAIKRGMAFMPQTKGGEKMAAPKNTVGDENRRGGRGGPRGGGRGRRFESEAPQAAPQAAPSVPDAPAAG